MNKTILLLLIGIVGLSACDALSAHDGKRLDIVVIDNQLYAQGYLSGVDPIDDGGGIVRPYFNVMHGHFTNVGTTIGSTQLPGFDIRGNSSVALDGCDVGLNLIGAGKWDDPPRQDGTGLAQDFGTPVLSQLSVGEVLSASLRAESVSTDSPGSLSLASDISGDAVDIDPSYEINLQPDNVIYFFEWELTSSCSHIQDSESVYTILSPDGVGPVERLHFQSLALERHFGIQAVPEPGCVSLVALVFAPLVLVRRR